MDRELALSIAETRLLQTWHLLHHLFDSHEDQAAVGSALEAIGAARDIIKHLRAE